MTKNLKQLLIAIITLLASTACKNSNTEILLTQVEAEKRSKMLENVSYKLNLDLTEKENFSGEVEISFNLLKQEELRLDFFEGKVQKLFVNEKETEVTIAPGVIKIPSSAMNLGQNSIKIQYNALFSRSGNGLHRFEDPDDGEVYLYTQFEAFHANKMFPCFDQPNIKATFSLEVKSPQNWEVISSTLPEKVEPQIDPKIKKITFKNREVFSTYLFSLHAGPYNVWSDSYKQIPLRLFARKSFSKFVNSDEWFAFTKQGFEFFEQYFEIPYPFSKYDQLIVPEFNSGAMENVAAVTFSERFISRGTVTRGQRENTSNVILHEMAHMWFGNLVTMNWWDGLWLNESFATYMATLAQSKNTEFTDSWESFSERMKEWAYEEDSYSTNHPIQGRIRDSEEAATHFDGITYGKGASVLKQLVFFVGEENFRIGIRDYLKQHAFKNTELSDFLSAMAKTSNRNLESWSNQWLEKKGTNTLALDWSCKPGKVNISLIQGFENRDNTYRNHRTLLKLYGNQKSFTAPVDYFGKKTLVSIDSDFCPEFIFTNYEDHDFVIPLWNRKMETQFLTAIQTETDPLTKFMLWDSYFDQVKSGKASIDLFYSKARDELHKENPIKLKRWLLAKISSDSSFSYLYTRFWLGDETKEKNIADLESFLWKGLQDTEPKSDLQKYWLSALKEATFTKQGQEILWKIYSTPESVTGLDLDQDQKWSILVKLSSVGFDESLLSEAFAKEKTKDTSLRGKNSALVFEAIAPKKETKEKFFDLLQKPKESGYSNSTLRSLASQLFPAYQKELESGFKTKIYDSFKTFNESSDENFVASYTQSLVISDCSQINTKEINAFLFWNTGLSPIVRKEITKHRDREKKCKKSRDVLVP